MAGARLSMHKTREILNQLEQGSSEPSRILELSGRILELDGANYRQRHFKRVCKAAGIGHYSPKDLRDTVTSQRDDPSILITLIPLPGTQDF